MADGKMIAVWGSAGSGKTTTSIKLASKLAGRKKDVIVVLTDVMAPDISVIMPFEKNINSMGSIWSTPDCSVHAIYNALNVTELDNVCLLGYTTGENVFSNPDYTKDNIMKVFYLLKRLADYIIVDCVSSFAYNVLSTVALELADKVLRLGEATPKAFSFFRSNLTLLSDSRYKSEQHIKVLAKNKDIYAKEAAINFMGGIDAALPYVDEVEYEMLSGELFHLSSDRELKDYDTELDRLMQMLDGKQKQKAGNRQRNTMAGMLKLWKARVEV